MKKHLALGIMLSVLSGSVASLSIELAFDIDANVDPEFAGRALSGFQQAATVWESIFFDPIAVTIRAGVAPLEPGVIGASVGSGMDARYSDVRSALIADAKTGVDATAVAHLPRTDTLAYFRNNPAADGLEFDDGASQDPFDNQVLYINTANAKALGLTPAYDGTQGSFPAVPNTEFDGDILFSSELAFDFDPSDGIDPDKFDFVGVAAHEIGHVLGFVSGVDFVDLFTGNGPLAGLIPIDGISWFSVLDLFRYSELSFVDGELIGYDWTTGLGESQPFFSVDGGGTSVGGFSTGAYNGDGRQASHWLDNAALGIMEPTARFGERLSVSKTDIVSFDAIGYDAMPSPSTLALMVSGLLGVGMARRGAS